MVFLCFHSLLLEGQKLKDPKQWSDLWKAKASGHIILVSLSYACFKWGKTEDETIILPSSIHFQNRNCINRERKQHSIQNKSGYFCREFVNTALVGGTLLKVSFTILRPDRRVDNFHDDISMRLYRDRRRTSPRRAKVLAISHTAVIPSSECHCK